MNVINKSIVLKLWLAMVMMVIIVLCLSGLVQTRELKEIYFNQQLDQLVKEGEHISSSIVENKLAPLADNLAVMAVILNANIMLVDNQGYIIECQGMGMSLSISGKEEQKINIMGYHGIPWQESDLESLRQGKTISYRGPNHFFDNDVLSVLLPVYRDEKVTGAVVLSKPLAPIEGRIIELQKMTLYTGIAGILLATFMSLLFSRTLSQPLLRMNKVARALAGGDYSCQVEVKSKDEIGLLAGSLNSLSLELQKKIAALDMLDQTRREFVANVSHELRTPLSIMLGYTEALIDGMAGNETEKQRYLNNIHEEILRLQRLVTELLDLRKMEAGYLNLEMQETNISAIAGRVLDKFQAVAEFNGINLIRNLPDTISPVFAHNDRLEEVFINLLDNAVRATPPGGTVELAIKDCEEKLQILISDTGPGIPSEEQPLIWERFYKVDKSRARSGGGTGLGLAIVKKIVEMHGGSIEVISKPGEGSIFLFTIPKRA